MKVWVKELSEYLTEDMVRSIIKKNVSLFIFTPETEVDVVDCVIVSKQDKMSEWPLCNIIIYEEVLEKIYSNIEQEYRKQYTYNRYYLENALLKARTQKVKNIFTGSSYGLYGIDDHVLGTDGINLSLHSQDLYYSTKGIYEVWKDNKNVKNIILCIGYYYFFSDLSKTQNSEEIRKVSTTYWPVFRDAHNCFIMPAEESTLFKSEIFDIVKMFRQYSLSEFQKGYWNDKRKRQAWASKLWKDKTKNWVDLSETEKDQAGQERATLHNKNRKRESTLRENTRLFEEFVSFCSQNQINLLVVVTPASRYYRTYADKEFEEIFYRILNGMDGDIHVLDLYENNVFVEEDFNDMDHLNDLGADKMTSMVLQRLKDIEDKGSRE